MLRFAGAGVSDVGRRRTENEDSAFIGPYVAVVADGLGGAAAGEVASATAAYVIAATAMARFGEDPASVLVRAVGDAQAALLAGVAADIGRAGMATTVTALVTDGRRVVLGHIGDSRAYLLHDDQLRQVSADHTYVQHLIDSGDLDPSRRAGHPWGHILLRSLGGGDDTVLDLTALPVEVGDRLLLCSDGLTDLVPDDRIAEALVTISDAQDAAAVLVEAGLSAGGKDNITCLVLDVVDGPEVVRDGSVLGALADPAHNVVDPDGVHLSA